jgi:large subunit ribosomal protein L22
MEKDIVYTKSKYIKGAPRKSRLVADLVRGKKAVEAVKILTFTNKKAAHDIKKVVAAGIANCENNKGWDKEALRVVEIRIDEAPTFKRIRQVSRGRAHRIMKRNHHITIGIKEDNNGE